MSSPLVCVVVLNWNRRRDTVECLRSVMRMTYPHFRLLLVDNGSTDGSIPFISAQFPGAEMIANETNLGYAGGCNVGIRYALAQDADYVLLLNNDTVVDQDMLSQLVDVAESDTRLGILGPLIGYYEDRQKVWSAGSRMRPLTLTATDRGQGNVGAHTYGPVRQVDYVFGCGMLVRRDVFSEVGLFDEGFFMYYEDEDFCLRARKRGYRIACVTPARMWHKVSVSAGNDTPLQRYYLARSSVRFFRKHTRPVLRPVIFLYRAGSALRAVASAVIKGRRDVAYSYLRGIREGLQDRPVRRAL